MAPAYEALHRTTGVETAVLMSLPSTFKGHNAWPILKPSNHSPSQLSFYGLNCRQRISCDLSPLHQHCHFEAEGTLKLGPILSSIDYKFEGDKVRGDPGNIMTVSSYHILQSQAQQVLWVLFGENDQYPSWLHLSLSDVDWIRLG
ncbi:g5386 [Coccomyxa elongata]